MDISYRSAVREDLPAIEALVKEAVSQMEANQIFQWDELYPIREDFLEDIQSNQLTAGWAGNQIVAIFSVNQDCDPQYANGRWEHPEKPFSVIHRLCVHPWFQNRGIAGKVMAYIEALLLAEGKQAVRLDVYSQNPYAVKLYLHCGYKKVGQAHWRKGLFYLMEKYIG